MLVCFANGNTKKSTCWEYPDAGEDHQGYHSFGISDLECVDSYVEEQDKGRKKGPCNREEARDVVVRRLIAKLMLENLGQEYIGDGDGDSGTVEAEYASERCRYHGELHDGMTLPLVS